MEKRALLAVAICLFIWIGWQGYWSKKQGKMTGSTVEETKKPEGGAFSSAESFQQLSTDKTIEGAEEKRGEPSYFENDLIAVTLSSKSGAIEAWKLKRYFNQSGSSGKNIEMVWGKEWQRHPLTIHFDSEVLEKGAQGTYQVIKKEGNQFQFQSVQNDVRVTKEYTFYPHEYFCDFKLKIEAPQRFVSEKQSVLFAIHQYLSAEKHRLFLGESERDKFLLTYTGSQLNRRQLKQLSPAKEEAVVDWVAFDTRYFLASLINRDKLKPFVFTDKEGELGRVGLVYPLYSESEHPGVVEIETKLYLGPKDIDVLAHTGHDLKKAIDFGWFSVFAVPLLRILKFFYAYIGNYGVAIILLTLLVRLLFYPLTKKSYESMKAMQRIQPQMNKIKEKYKDDRDTMNKEIMQLMKTNRVNPLGGCLPMLFQMPVFFALYRVLYSAIELYHAPFGGWIRDLSGRDPYFITPILLGGAMFIQQKMTPTQMDPAQAKVMLFMPILFSAFMLYLPSGLVIYILFSTLLQVAHQFWMNRQATA